MVFTSAITVFVWLTCGVLANGTMGLYIGPRQSSVCHVVQCRKPHTYALRPIFNSCAKPACEEITRDYNHPLMTTHVHLFSIKFRIYFLCCYAFVVLRPLVWIHYQWVIAWKISLLFSVSFVTWLTLFYLNMALFVQLINANYSPRFCWLAFWNNKRWKIQAFSLTIR